MICLKKDILVKYLSSQTFEYLKQNLKEGRWRPLFSSSCPLPGLGPVWQGIAVTVIEGPARQYSVLHLIIMG